MITPYEAGVGLAMVGASFEREIIDRARAVLHRNKKPELRVIDGQEAPVYERAQLTELEWDRHVTAKQIEFMHEKGARKANQHRRELELGLSWELQPVRN